MFCEECGKEISDSAQFCGYCGHSYKDNPKPEVLTDQEETKEKPQEDKKEKRVRKKRKGWLAFALSFFIFLGLLSGMWGAYYIEKNGWKSIPYSEKLTFLPFVKFEEPKMETYSDPLPKEEDNISDKNVKTAKD